MSDNDEQRLDLAQKDLGMTDVKVVSAGSTYSARRFYGVRALGGDLQLNGAGTAAGSDDIPATTIQQDTILMAPYTDIDVAAGSAGKALLYLLND